ncbi:MAG: response regulator, partial [Polyangiaceae bacterium]
CRQMLAYAGKATLVSEAVDLSALVADMSSMLELSVSKKVTFARELAVSLPMVVGDPTQIRQVIMNLVINASEAIGEAAGTVRVSTGAGELGADAFARSAAGGDPKPGKYAYFCVEDDGIGMDAPTVAQMFDPFFTTKFVGRGLGMAAVLGIVRGHSGVIDVESTPGKGTRVRIFFPAHAIDKPRAPSPAPVLARGEGVVLVVDDEQAVRASTQLLLQELGFEAVLARDGVEALDILRTESHGIDVVLLDATMPRMAGAETLREIRKLAPRVPVILSSGYLTAGSEARTASGIMADAVLAKPYTVEELLESLNRAMRHARK